MEDSNEENHKEEPQALIITEQNRGCAKEYLERAAGKIQRILWLLPKEIKAATEQTSKEQTTEAAQGLSTEESKRAKKKQKREKQTQKR